MRNRNIAEYQKPWDVFCRNNNILVSIIGVGISSGCWILVSRKAKEYSW